MPIASTGIAAQLTATLQSGDNVTPFYGSDSFKEALTAAADGDIITLSPGEFNTAEVTKGVSIIGAYAFSEDASKITKLTTLTVSADNVTLEGIRFGTLTVKGTENLNVKRCYLSYISDGDPLDDQIDENTHDNTILTDCIVAKYDAMSNSKNTVIRNSCVNYFADTNSSSNIALIENCNIPVFAYYDTSINSGYKRPYAIYRKCLLGLYQTCGTNYTPTLNLYSPSEFTDIVFVTNHFGSSSSSNCVPYTINFNSCKSSNILRYYYYNVGYKDGSFRYGSYSSFTYISLTVGPSEFKKYPSIPAISSSSIDTKTDAEGVLHVTITATARD